MNKFLSVCIPMYNESKIVLSTIKTLVTYMESEFGKDGWEIIFSNDGSKDDCGITVKDYSENDSRVRLVGYSENKGKGCAVRTAVLSAEGEYVLYTDCDLAYGCEMIGNMYNSTRKNGCDIMIGSRNISKDGYDGYGFLRKLMSKTYIKVISLLCGFSHTDSQCGIKCFKNKAAKSIFSECSVNGFAFDLEVLIVAGQKKYKISEMPVKVINNRESESKVNPIKDALKMLKDVRNIKKMHRQR